MPDIFHNFLIKAFPDKVFDAITTSRGLNNWWTKSSDVRPEPGGTYTLNFGPGYEWKAVVSKYEPDKSFELEMTETGVDWPGTKVGFLISFKTGATEVAFYHTGWPENNEHYKISSYCWAMYLRILKRYVEIGEKVPYENRLNV